MKKPFFVLVSLLCLTVLSSFAVKPNCLAASDSSSVISAALQDYCPKGYICEAVNCKAQGDNGASRNYLTGISIYKNSNGDVIAYIPGYGHIKCYWMGGAWHFDADGGCYKIIGYTRK